MAGPDPALSCYLLDTRSLWPGERITQSASALLPLLSPSEQDSVTRKHFARDARMSLASALLKRFYIVRTISVPWSRIHFSRLRDPIHGKPCLLSPTTNLPVATPSFNVTHQAGLVALIGSSRETTDVGIDIVCVNERNDTLAIDRDGFGAWVDVYEDFFSEAELFDIKYSIPEPGITLLDGTQLSSADLGRHDRCVRRDQLLTVIQTLPNGGRREVHFMSDILVDAKLRRFYAFWAYKEAYIKLTGEAMLASWLRDLEFRNVRAPGPGTVARCSTLGVWGEKVRDAEVWLRGERVSDVRIELQSFEEDYMIAVAVRGAEGVVPEMESVDVERDVIPLTVESVA
ncbi:hypothetical protein K490DRAFT_65969 [Saccharata proteae CBS 121410]|uniref:holo-[acyl-carrier-protein] synthase n=1 Tax=Saccharata proteae CBS 121410 TaxID=1314787 RepID=A0A9P4LX01_9PEZI|nr:hypothetical protein K490DRAFT_65969 [Saccharata proteae CBS 121410]